MILETTADLKKYVSIYDSFQFADFEPYITKAVNTYTKKYVGNLHVELANEVTGTNSEIKNEAREHLRNAIANFGMFSFFPFLQIQIDSSGASVSQSENRGKPEWWQIKDARREFLRSGHEAMDFLLEILEANPTIFTDYATNYSSINKELIISNASLFSKYYNIFNSRQTYLALQPTLRLVEDQYIKTFLCSELVVALKSTTTGKVKEVQEAIQKAIVSFTVAKVSNNGLFLLDDRGLRVDFENMIDGRRENPSYGKAVDQIKQLANELIDNGTNYLQIAKQIIEENPSEFTQCENPLIKSATSGSGFVPYIKGGVVGL